MLGRDWLRLLELGGNVYYTYKLAACDGMTFQDLAGQQTGMTAEDFAQMMLPAAGRSPEGSRTSDRVPRGPLMARVVGGVGCSHVPAVGAAIDKGTTADPYWAPYFAKVEPARAWMAEVEPDVCIVVYNDHASAFSLEIIPTFALGLADEFPPADEGYGPRPVPAVQGHPELAWHLAESLILDEFDLTLVNEMPVDHGLTVPLSVLFGQPEEWPCRVVPLCVNVVQYPPPTGNRCYRLGQAIRRAVERYRRRRAGRGVRHRRHVAPAAGRARRADQRRVRHRLPRRARARTRSAVAAISHVEYLREAGSEGIELVMWLVMRGAPRPGATRSTARPTCPPRTPTTACSCSPSDVPTALRSAASLSNGTDDGRRR